VTEEVKTEEVKAHQTSASMVKAALGEVDAGTDMALKVRVSCPEKCNLQGSQVRIVDDEGAVITEIELTDFDETGNETGEFAVKAPVKLGAHTWTAVFAAQEKEEGVPHEESSAPFPFIIKPHSTSMAVWDAPSPIVVSDKFKLKVGVRCSAECKLTGQEVEIYDQGGGKVATGTLGDVPWQDTAGLYWAEVEVEAPITEGFYSLDVKFPKPDLELPHEGAASSFASRTVRPPEHVVTVEVIDKEKNTPLKKAVVTLHSSGTTYREYTDEGGVAKLSVPKGEYELLAVTIDYLEFRMAAYEVAGDATIKAELIYWPSDRQGVPPKSQLVVKDTLTHR